MNKVIYVAHVGKEEGEVIILGAYATKEKAALKIREYIDNDTETDWTKSSLLPCFWYSVDEEATYTKCIVEY